MTLEKIPFKSVTGKPLTLYIWQGENTEKGTVQLVHGMCEYIGRYEKLAADLCAEGYRVVGHSHLGHGENAGKDELGYFGEKDGWDHLVLDVKGARETAEKRYPGGRWILLGHSMGSFVVREYMIRFGSTLDAAVLSGTGWYPAFACRAGLALAYLDSFFGGWKKSSALLHWVTNLGYNSKYPDKRTESDWLTRDEKIVDAYIADPLCGFKFTTRGYFDMFTGLKELSKPERLSSMPSELPVYFVSGDEDPVGSQGKGVRTVAEQFRNHGMKNVTVRLYPGGRHEVFNEINRNEVIKDLLDWLKEGK